jgi:hypothetical protein
VGSLQALVFAERAASPSIAHVKKARAQERASEKPQSLEDLAEKWERPQTPSPLKKGETDKVRETTRAHRKRLQEIMFDYVSGAAATLEPRVRSNLVVLKI